MPDGCAPTSVLIVDDNAAAARTLSVVLRAEGYYADCASDATEALDMARGQPYGAALIDIGLPGRSGLDVLGDLKAERPELIAIMVTGQASAESSIEALNRGAGGYVQKPVDVRQLLGLLRSGVEKQRLEADNRRMLRRLSLLYAVGAQAGGGLEACTTLQETISLVASLLDLPAGGIWWMRGEGAVPLPVASVGLSEALTAEVTARLAALDPTPASGGHQCPPWRDIEVGHHNGSACWRLRVIPLQGHQGAVGYMAVGGPDWVDDQVEEAEVLSAVAWQVAVAMENMRLYEDLRVALERLQEAQAQVVQAEKLSAVGRVVSGVAHELNNPLMVILGYADLLRDDHDGLDTREAADRIFTHAQRAGQIIEGLLAFSRGARTVLRPVDLSQVIGDSLDATERHRIPGVVLQLGLPGSFPTIQGDPGALQQVLTNIIANACQAMGEAGGVLTLTAGISDEITLRITDTGPGIPDEVLGRIFEPFFTTKGVGQGTGLGLSIVHGIVRDHGGEITADNRPEGGAVFTIRLPIRQPEPDVVRTEAVQDAPWLQPTGGELN